MGSTVHAADNVLRRLAEGIHSVVTKCRNCGHDCHCGVPLFKDVRTYNDEVNDGHGEKEQIEVCKNCRCERCEKVE